MDVLRSLNLDGVIREVVRNKTPFLGICLGAQIILETSEEDNADCLNLIVGRVRRFPEMGLKIPHMGWNSISVEREHPILKDINPEAQFYFVHSYYPEPRDREHIIATTDYGIPFASIIGRDNVVATQFHPEKSGRFGLHMLKNFIEWNVTC
jgi:glutamine amidotransferase